MTSIINCNKDYLAYNKYCANNNNKPGIIFLCGFKSDMNGTKAMAFEQYAKKNDLDYLKFDYYGHGSSSGEFIDGTIGQWLEDTLTIIDNVASSKPQILIGSSMGGWIMLLAALKRPTRIKALLGLAAAPDFTEELIWNEMTLAEKEQIAAQGQIEFGNEFCSDNYLISNKLILEARNHLLLDKKIPLNMPIRLIHGMDDKDVPFNTATRIAQQVTSDDVQVHLLKSAGHRLSEAHELEFIYKEIDKLTAL